MSQNVPQKPFRWTEVSEQAVGLLASDELNDEEIAARVNVNRRTLTRWKLHPEFAAALADIVRAAGDVSMQFSIARRVNRIRQLDKRWRACQQIAEERGNAPEMQNVPGGKTGYLVHRIKSVGSGPAAQVVDEYELDAALLREIREHEKQAAQELGQWIDKKDVTSDGKRITEFISMAGVTLDDVAPDAVP